MDITSYLMGKKQGGGTTPNLQDKSVPINSNTTTTIEADDGYDGLGTVSVTTNVPSYAQLDVSSIKFKNSRFTTLPQAIVEANWEMATDLTDVFYQCALLTSIPHLNTTNATKFNSCFSNCEAITSADIDTSSATSMYQTFINCKKLETVVELDCSNVNELSTIFYNCPKLTNLGGFKDLGKGYDTTKQANYASYTLGLASSSLITHDSLMNVINKLYDIASAGCNIQTLNIGATNKAKLTAEEIAIAENKGWNVT